MEMAWHLEWLMVSGLPKKINPKLVIPIHLQHPKDIMNPDIDKLKQNLELNCLNYRIMKVGETIEFNSKDDLT